MQKIFYATRLKVIDGCFHQLMIEPKDVPVFKMPNYIQNCEAACNWISDIHPIDITKTLCGIACSDNIVVVNTNHSVHDAGYCHSALKHCLDDSLPTMPVLMKNFRNEINQRIKDKGFLREVIPSDGWNQPDDVIYGCLSNVGPMKIVPPVKDFYLKGIDTGATYSSMFFIFSISKVGQNRNTLIADVKTAPDFITRENEYVLWNSWKYWMTHIKPETRIKDAFDEMREVQAKLSDEF